MKKLALIALLLSLGINLAYAEVQWTNANSFTSESGTNKLVIAGYEIVNGKKVAAVERRIGGDIVGARGQLDASFGKDGVVIIPFGVESYITTIIISPDGKKTLHGFYVTTSSNEDISWRNDRKEFEVILDANGKVESAKAVERPPVEGSGRVIHYAGVEYLLNQSPADIADIARDISDEALEEVKQRKPEIYERLKPYLPKEKQLGIYGRLKPFQNK